MATPIPNEEVARALMLGDEGARANGHHAMIGAEYILYGALVIVEQESAVIEHRGVFGHVSAEMVMRRIVLIRPHSDFSDDTMRSECYDSTLRIAIQLAEQAGSEVVDLEHLSLAIVVEQGSTVNLAQNILRRFTPSLGLPPL